MIKIFENEEEVAQEIAREMKDHLFTDQHPVFCLASGSTPQKAIRNFPMMRTSNGKSRGLTSLAWMSGLALTRALKAAAIRC